MFIFRHMHKLKRYIHNNSWPKGSIAEGCLADECLTFCSWYLHDIETKFNHPKRNFDGDSFSRDISSLSVFCALGLLFGKSNMQDLRDDFLNVAIIYILQNCENIESFIKKTNSIFCKNIYIMILIKLILMLPYDFYGEHKNILSDKGVRNIDETHKRGFPSWFKKWVS